jgi:hypothetical protein
VRGDQVPLLWSKEIVADWYWRSIPWSSPQGLPWYTLRYQTRHIQLKVSSDSIKLEKTAIIPKGGWEAIH